MDLIDKIQAISTRIPRQIGHIQTEEATKNAFIMPFISALGYDVFNPTEVMPEFTADVGTKKGEKVDYAIFQDGKISMIFECKWCGDGLKNDHASQLRRYFSVTETRIGVLTNGIIYQFYSDLDQPNIMDEKPFLVLDMLNIREGHIIELKKLSRDTFDLDEMLSSAAELKYTRAIKALLRSELANPSEEFVKFFAKQVYFGKVTQSVREQFTGIVKLAFRQFINDNLNERLQGAIQATESTVDDETEVETEDTDESIENNDGIVTTEEEMEGYRIVRAILREVVDIRRVVHRDTKSYMGILLDNNNRKPVCRLMFNRSQKYLVIFDESRTQHKLAIDTVDDVYNHADALKAIVAVYTSGE